MMYGNYYPHMAGGYEHHFFGLGILAMLIFWVVIVMIVVALVRWASGHKHGCWHEKEKSSTNNAIEILKERYAKGEINKEEFEIKKKDLLA
jgi:putative membrane protein